MILLNYLTLFAFAVSGTDFYSLAKRIFFLGKREFDGIIDVQPSVFRINSFSRRISLAWNQVFTFLDYFQVVAAIMYLNLLRMKNHSYVSQQPCLSLTLDMQLCLTPSNFYISLSGVYIKLKQL